MAELCNACREIFHVSHVPQRHPIIGTQETFDAQRWGGRLDFFQINGFRQHHESPSGVQTAAETGCMICKILFKHWDSFDQVRQVNILKSLSIVQLSLSSFLGMRGQPPGKAGLLSSRRKKQDPQASSLWREYRRIGSVYRLQQLKNDDVALLQFQFGDASNDRFVFELHPQANLEHQQRSHVSGQVELGVVNTAAMDETLAQIKIWFQDCVQSHSTCACEWVTEKKTLPARLIDIGLIDEPKEPCLQILNENHPTVEYATLSHCWGSLEGLRPPSLQSKSLDAMKSGMPVDGMPRTFQDAITVARRLGIRYIWIDSLCIIQDCSEDWERESSKMGIIYKNAVCNFAAEDSPNCQGGLFFHRDSLPMGIFAFARESTPNLPGGPYISFAQEYLALSFERLYRSPLSSRAWVYQERILSQRQISFLRDQVFWECRTLRACETLPAGKPIAKKGTTESRRRQLLREEPRRPFSRSLNENRKFNPQWADVVESYTKRSLTKESDKLVAIQGIANRSGLPDKDQYLAGLWRGDLEFGLMWTVENGLQANGAPSYRPARYRAPSWSWASVEGIVKMYSSSREGNVLITIVDANLASQSRHATGQVSGGYITLRGHLVSTDSRWVTNSSGTPIERQKFQGSRDQDWRWLNCAIDVHRNDTTGGIFLLPILSHEEGSRRTITRGLILTPRNKRNNTFVRLGLFCDEMHRPNGNLNRGLSYLDSMKPEDRDTQIITLV